MNETKHIRPAPAQGSVQHATQRFEQNKKDVFSTEKQEDAECQSTSLIGRKKLKDEPMAGKRCRNNR
jgi:deferrochelatase/peroxidase EfeB